MSTNRFGSWGSSAGDSDAAPSSGWTFKVSVGPDADGRDRIQPPAGWPGFAATEPYVPEDDGVKWPPYDVVTAASPTAALLDGSMLVRINFDSDLEWDRVVRAASKPVPQLPFADTFWARFILIDNPAFRSVEAVLSELGPDVEYGHVYFADDLTFTHPENPLLAIDLHDQTRVRFIPAESWSVENNMWCGNMELSDFATSADEDGIFRGF